MKTRWNGADRIRRAAVAVSIAGLALGVAAGARAQEPAAETRPVQERVAQLNGRVAALYGQGKYAEAKAVAKQALALAESELGPDHPDTAASLNNLASLLQAMGDLPGRTVLAADTMIGYGGRVYGKPETLAAAVELLADMAGRTHRLATGVCVIAGGRERCRIAVTRVTLRALDRASIRRIVARGDPRRYAGGYAIRRKGDPLIERIEGSFTNGVGLPMEAVKEILRDS